MSTPPAKTGPTPLTKHIPALDGVRGIAVIVIMVYHGGVLFTAGGFFGVDTFFTLSGFLITGLLIDEWRRTGTINRTSFYARRARRLLPALFLTVIGVAVYERYLVSPGTFPGLRDDALSALGFVANWRFLEAGSSYFTQTGPTSPLLHTWSLGVEEQFYLIWPLVLFLVLRRTKSLRILLAVTVGLTVASAIEMAVLYSPSEVNRVFFGTDTRGQALMVGCALACGIAMHHGEPLTAKARAILTSLGIAGVVGSVILWSTVNANNAFAYQGGFLAAGLASAAVIANVALDRHALVAHLLSFPPLRYIGQISYGLYLWHFPTFAYLDGSRVGWTQWPLFGVRAAATLALATVSFYLVERPIRRGALTRTRRRAWLVTPSAVIVTVVAAVVGTTIPAAAIPIPHLAHSALYRGPPVRVLILGDSVALTLGLGLYQDASNYDVNESSGAIIGCGVLETTQVQVKGVDLGAFADCNPTNATQPQRATLWRRSITSFHPNVVMILVGRWEVSNDLIDGHWTNIDNASFARDLKRRLSSAVALAGSTGAHVVLLTAPCSSSGEKPNGEGWPEDSRSRLVRYNDLLRSVAAEHPVTVSLLDFDALVCPGGRYQEFVGNTQLRTSDGVHFTLVGGALLGERLWPSIVRLGRAQMSGTAAGAGP